MSIELPLYAQAKRNTCALACLRMVLAAFGIDVEEGMLEDQARMEPEGTDIGELERLARNSGSSRTYRRRQSINSVSSWRRGRSRSRTSIEPCST